MLGAAGLVTLTTPSIWIFNACRVQTWQTQDPRSGRAGRRPAGRARTEEPSRLPYERRLANWQVRRWQARHRYDIRKTENDNGPEYVRLFAAYCAEMTWRTPSGRVHDTIGDPY